MSAASHKFTAELSREVGSPTPKQKARASAFAKREGVVFLTAASADEDAQESDELRGSCFTHYLVSGLLGAADVNGDGFIVLDEAYRYAYEHTLRASSRTLAGTQHPTFRYEIKGRGDVVLTDLRRPHRRSSLVFPRGRSYLVFHDDRQGRVVAEVGASGAAASYTSALDATSSGGGAVRSCWKGT